MNNDINIVLASGSPRRQELLKLLYCDFKIIPADIDENFSDKCDPYEVAEKLAVKKAMSVKNSSCLVIGCDTIVISDNNIMGKPQNSEQAFKMLSSLSGKIHDVVTGVCLCYKGKSYSFKEVTNVEFYPLSDEEISAYIMTGECKDKAGAYGIQGLGSLFVKRINGDFYNVVGLPVSRLRHEIKRFLKIADLT